MKDANGSEWIDVVREAQVEVTSEDDLFPITHALEQTVTNGWRASTEGVQFVRLVFPEPRRIRKIFVHVVDRVSERTQEMVIRAGSSMTTLEEVARRKFSFSPRGNTEELEEYAVALDRVTVVELRIDPDERHSGQEEQMYAVLKSFWLA